MEALAAIVVLSYGMGVDSSAILLRWLTDPTSRDFDLSQLVVVTAQTGNEWADAPAQATRHLLPLLRQLGVRFVEVARHGPTVADGITVLQDSRAPVQLHPEGDYKLSDEMTASATIPQRGGRRLCSLKSKGDVIDRWLAATFPQGYRHAVGFAVGEEGRAKTDTASMEKNKLVGHLRRPFYPLLEWGWNRRAAEDFLLKNTGEAWAKSCCTFCPFSSDLHLGRDDDEALAATLRFERNALAFNVEQQLFGKGTALWLYRRSRPEAVALHDAALESATWALYELKRAWAGALVPYRSIVKLAEGTQADMEAQLAALGPVTHDGRLMFGGTKRVVVWDRPEKGQLGAEHFYVVAPADTPTKVAPGFGKAWDRVAAITVRRLKFRAAA